MKKRSHLNLLINSPGMSLGIESVAGHMCAWAQHPGRLCEYCCVWLLL